MQGKINLTDFENSSIMRRFTIFFIVMSLIPLSLLYYFYIQVQQKGLLALSEGDFGLTLIFVVLGVFVGFIGMKMSLKGLIDVTEASKRTLKGVLGAKKFKELTENKNEVAVLTRTFDEITLRLEENVRKLELAKKTLHSVLERVSRGISSMENIDNFLNLIIETVTEALSAKVGVIMLKSDKEDYLEVKSVCGARLSPRKTKKGIKITEENFAPAVTARTPLVVKDLAFSSEETKNFGHLFRNSVLCAPLQLHDSVLGLMCVSGRTEEDFKSDELNLMGNLALQTAVAIENSRLNEDAEKTYFETISALALAVEARDQYSRGHLDRVADYSTLIAKKLNLTEEEITVLRDAARLHDIGKIGIPDDILKKPAGLNPQEREMMRKHPQIGENIIKPISSLRSLCDVIRHHHEFLDGSGYPDGLKGEEISLLARILTIADIYDALTTTRSYRRAYSVQKAKQELIKMGSKLDQNIVKVFLETL